MSEIEAFPRAVLSHHYPDVPLHGDFTTIQAGEYGAIDVLVGGTPCQSFSIAGLRGGMADARGNLALEYLRLAERLRARWVLWENVPGVLSSNGGRDFGAFVGGLAELGYGWAYRSLDAQYFGLAQRRERVFVVGCLGDWRRAAQVLSLSEGLRGDHPPRREAREGIAAPIAAGSAKDSGYRNDADTAGNLITATSSGRGWWDTGEVAATIRAQDSVTKADILVAFGGNDTRGPIDIAAALNACGTASGRQDFESETFISHSLRADGFDASEDGTGRGTPLVPTYAIQERAVSENLANGPQGKGWQQDIGYTLEARNKVQAVAFNWQSGGDCRIDPREEQAHALQRCQTQAVMSSGVRRLTPTECERLMGFRDNYTLVPWRGGMASDGPRYKSLGNSMAVPCIAWIGRRIQAAHERGATP